jgi:hypothetical protein
MKRPYKEFVERRLGKKVDYDKAFWYQCVDLIKQYADECLGMWKIGAIGNAKNVPKGIFWKRFWQIYTSFEDVMQWDIIVRTRGEYWHIAIVDHIYWWKIYVLEQNWSGKNSWSWTWDNAIRVQPYSFNFYNVIMRNDDIVKNFNTEYYYVEDKIKERTELLQNTIEYKATLQLK